MQSMWHCFHCGTDNVNGEPFCIFCGKPAPEVKNTFRMRLRQFFAIYRPPDLYAVEGDIQKKAVGIERLYKIFFATFFIAMVAAVFVFAAAGTNRGNLADRVAIIKPQSDTLLRKTFSEAGFTQLYLPVKLKGIATAAADGGIYFFTDKLPYYINAVSVRVGYIISSVRNII